MSDIELNLLPPPPPPPANLNDTITLGDSDVEDGEIQSTPSPQDSQQKKKSRNNNNKPARVDDDDIQVIGDNLFELDDDGEEEPSSFNANVTPTIRISGCIGMDTPTPKSSGYRGTCFNCGGGHTLSECKERLDQRKIMANRKSFQGGKKDTRIHDNQSQFKAGKLSAHALEALDLEDDEYPHWIYRMREQGPSLGYPPGYLKQLMPKGEGLTFFTDDARLSGKLEQAPFDFDATKVVFYEGFNLIDERSDLERAAQKFARRTYDPFTKETYTEFLEKFVRRLHECDSRKQNEETERRLDRKLMAKVAKKVEKEMYRANEDELREVLKTENIDPTVEPERYLKFVEENDIPLSRKDRKRIEKNIAKRAALAEAELKAAIGLVKPAKKGNVAVAVKQEAVAAAAVTPLTNGVTPVGKMSTPAPAAKAAPPTPAAPSTPAPSRPKVRSIHTQTKPVLITELPEPSPEHKQQAHKQQRVAARATVGKKPEVKPVKPKPAPKEEPLYFPVENPDEPEFIFPSQGVSVPKPAVSAVVEAPRKPLGPLPPVLAPLIETGSDYVFPNGSKLAEPVETPAKAPEKSKRVTPRRFDSSLTHVEPKTVVPTDPKPKPSSPKKAKPVVNKPATVAAVDVKEVKENVKPEKKEKTVATPASPKKTPRQPAEKKPVESAKKAPEAAKPEQPVIVAQGDLSSVNGNAVQNGAPLTKSQRKKANKKKNAAAAAATPSQPDDPWAAPAPKAEPTKQAPKVVATPVNTGSASTASKQPSAAAKAAPKSKKQEKRAGKTTKDHLADLIDDKDSNSPILAASPSNGKGGHYDEDTPVARKQARGLNKSNVDAVIEDSPASPENPPVVSRALTEDQAQPREILVPTVDDRRMPNIDNFSNGILPFEHTNVQASTGRFDAITQLIKSRREEEDAK